MTKMLTEPLQLTWIQTDKPLTDGWYWRKCKPDDPDPDCIEVINGIMVDKRPRDSFGTEWEVYEHDEFKGWWWYGPLKVPPQQGKITKEGNFNNLRGEIKSGTLVIREAIQKIDVDLVSITSELRTVVTKYQAMEKSLRRYEKDFSIGNVDEID